MSDVRDRQLDGLRAVAVTMVLYAHFLAAEDSFWGHVGVRLFFVLSGFLITRLLLDARSAAGFRAATTFKAFYARRALRIFPPYFAMLAFVWLVDLEQSRGNLAWHALYLSNFWYALSDAWDPWFLCHLWSLSIEEQFYLLWPLIILLAPRQSIERICLAVILLSLAYRLYWPITGSPSLARDLLPPASMDALAAGALLAAYRTRSAIWPQWAKLSWIPLALASLTLLWLRLVPTSPVLDWLRWIALEAMPLLPLVMLVGCCSSGMGGPIGRVLQARLMVALGTVSYGIYLFHAVVLALVVKAQPWIPVNVAEQGPSRFLVAGLGTLLLAAFSWLVFERRINVLKRHFPYVAARGRGLVVERAEWLPSVGNTVAAPNRAPRDGVDAYPLSRSLSK